MLEFYIIDRLPLLLGLLGAFGVTALGTIYSDHHLQRRCETAVRFEPAALPGDGHARSKALRSTVKPVAYQQQTKLLPAVFLSSPRDKAVLMHM